MTPLHRITILAALFTLDALPAAARGAQQPPDPPAFDAVLNQPANPAPAYPPPFQPPSYQPPPYPLPGHSYAGHAAQSGRMFAEAAPGYLSAADAPHRVPPVDGMPTSPAHVAPDHWSAPGGTPNTPPADVAAEIFKLGQIIAWVGDQPVLAGDLMWLIEQAMAPQLAKLSPDELRKLEKEIDRQKQAALKPALGNVVETKLLYLDFIRNLPTDKRKEVLPRVTKRAGEQFEEKKLPELMEKANVSSPGELDEFLRRFGSTLEKQKQSYVELMMGQAVLGQKINYQPEVTHQEMLDYYREHLPDFDRPAQARWEKLTVKFDRFPNKVAAWATLGEMGNEVLRGASFAEVAKRASQAADAADGGNHDWTTRNSLASEILNEAIFSLPLGLLSERLEDQRELHIVRVVERREAFRVPFLDAQVEIKELIKKQKIRDQIKAYVEKIKKDTYVWTVFDAEKPQPNRTASPQVASPTYR